MRPTDLAKNTLIVPITFSHLFCTYIDSLTMRTHINIGLHSEREQLVTGQVNTDTGEPVRQQPEKSRLCVISDLTVAVTPATLVYPLRYLGYSLLPG